MKNSNRFKCKPLSTKIAASVLALSSQSIFAQDSAPIEEVVVTGIRASLQNAMSIKRDSAGVVDAISAEDIGKFPDTNLAESLQRITGVSISRANGEGSRVTVRGFGAEYNMVTLNGRTMPAAGAYGAGQGSSRAFDFANLASESVSAVEVYKTSKANIATGGVGATINIKTARPMDDPGLKMSVGAKAIMDTTNRTGNNVTPELSGIFSWTDDNEVFGIGLSGSYQERDSGSSSASVNDWRVSEWVPQGEAQAANGAMNIANGVNGESGKAYYDSRITNEPKAGQLYALPNDVRYHFSDVHRERTNTQLTLQYRPIESVTATADFTYANNQVEENFGDKTAWMNRSADYVVFDTNATIATPVLISERLGGTKDFNFEQTYTAQDNTLRSAGINIEWAVSDLLTLDFDAHSSSIKSLPGADFGSRISTSVAAGIGLAQTYDFSGDLPELQIEFDDSTKGNNNGLFDAGDLGSQPMRVWYTSQATEVDQFKLDGVFELENGKVDFGIETSSLEMKQQYSEKFSTLGDWGLNDSNNIPEGLLEPFNTVGQFDDYNTGNIDQVGFRGDARAIAQWAVGEYDSITDYNYDPAFSENHTVKEDTQTLYFQVEMNGEIGGLEANMLAGMRYENTDSTSTSIVVPPSSIHWLDNNDFNIVRDQSATLALKENNSYSHLLPSFDFDITLREGLKARYSFGQTIARPQYNDLRASVSVINPSGPTLTGIDATASASNPQLLPIESTNSDLSVEWYFDDTSYVSVGYYDKRVKNFIGSENVAEPQFGLRDATNGQRILAAQAALLDRGFQAGETQLFVMAAILDNPADFTPANAPANYNPADAYQDNQAFWDSIGGTYDIVPNETDPLYSFATRTPINNDDAHINGFEIAVQHFFADTGFGVMANYTTVNSDVSFNNGAAPGESQFSILGLSDSANLALMYEKYDVQARLAYNWRDEYLDDANRGASNNPRYVEAYYQLDLNVSYSITDNISLSFEGINITSENSRSYGRSKAQLWDLFDLDARYQLGARYTF